MLCQEHQLRIKGAAQGQVCDLSGEVLTSTSLGYVNLDDPDGVGRYGEKFAELVEAAGADYKLTQPDPVPGVTEWVAGNVDSAHQRSVESALRRLPRKDPATLRAGLPKPNTR